jgi:hypothetical protein
MTSGQFAGWKIVLTIKKSDTKYAGFNLIKETAESMSDIHDEINV